MAMADYIEREALLTQIAKGTIITDDIYGMGIMASVDAVTRMVLAQPAADVAPVVHGEWLLRHVGHGHYWECSICHKNPCIYVTKDTNYCPNCGAKMDGKSNVPRTEGE